MNRPETTSAAYGGPNWSPRSASLTEELGTVWASCGIDSEWRPLKRVLLHRPGPELDTGEDADAALFLDAPDADVAGRQHDALADAYRGAGVDVAYVDPPVEPAPNLVFCADLMFMTPSGAIVGRPASTVRAGEERWIARRLADMGVPILRCVGGSGVFEGADAMWLNPETVLIGCGLRTNMEGVIQVASTLAELGVQTIQVDLTHGTMHLMGRVRIVDRDLVFIEEGRLPWTAVDALADFGYDVRGFPSPDENRTGFAHNFVTLGPRRVLMPAGNPRTEAALAEEGLECITVDVSEIGKAAGSIGCMTAVVERER